MPPPLDIIKVIHATLNTSVAIRQCKGVISITLQQELEQANQLEKKARMGKEKRAFDDEDLEGTMQPHDDALVVTLWSLS